jgi:hypothetical protein
MKATLHPNSDVLGTDLSPIQPELYVLSSILIVEVMSYLDSQRPSKLPLRNR